MPRPFVTGLKVEVRPSTWGATSADEKRITCDVKDGEWTRGWSPAVLTVRGNDGKDHRYVSFYGDTKIYELAEVAI